jgi:hypothetical protein
MTEQDELSRLARAITNAEDNLNESNHRDDCETLAQMDETRSHLVERIDAKEKALNDARDAFLALAKGMASESAVKVEITEPGQIQYDDPTLTEQQALFARYGNKYQTAEPQPYSNGLDGHKED